MEFVLVYNPLHFTEPLLVSINSKGIEAVEVFDAMVAEIKDTTKNNEDKSPEGDILLSFKSVFVPWMVLVQNGDSGSSKITVDHDTAKISIFTVADPTGVSRAKSFNGTL